MSFEAGGGGGDDLAESAFAAAQDVSSGGADTGAGPSLLGGRKPPVRLETGTTEGSEVGEDAAAVEVRGSKVLAWCSGGWIRIAVMCHALLRLVGQVMGWCKAWRAHTLCVCTACHISSGTFSSRGTTVWP
jgi:hypothetical protein